VDPLEEELAEDLAEDPLRLIIDGLGEVADGLLAIIPDDDPNLGLAEMPSPPRHDPSGAGASTANTPRRTNTITQRLMSSFFRSPEISSEIEKTRKSQFKKLASSGDMRQEAAEKQRSISKQRTLNKARFTSPDAEMDDVSQLTSESLTTEAMIDNVQEDFRRNKARFRQLQEDGVVQGNDDNSIPSLPWWKSSEGTAGDLVNQNLSDEDQVNLEASQRDADALSNWSAAVRDRYPATANRAAYLATQPQPPALPDDDDQFDDSVESNDDQFDDSVESNDDHQDWDEGA
jgi:hypothetical protein